MKTRNLFFVFLIFCFASLSAETVIMAVGEWGPFISEKMDGHGVAGKIVTAAFKTQNIDVAYSYYPWERSRMLVEEGDMIATLPWYYDKNKENYGFFSDEMISTNEVFFYRKSQFPNGFTFKNLTDLMQYNIGGVRGYKHVKDLKNAGIHPDITAKASTGFLKLEKGRIDFMPESELVGWQLIDELFPGQRDSFGVTNPLISGKMFVLFSKNHPKAKEMLAVFNKGLKQIKENGTFDKIVSEYK